MPGSDFYSRWFPVSTHPVLFKRYILASSSLHDAAVSNTLAAFLRVDPSQGYNGMEELANGKSCVLAAEELLGGLAVSEQGNKGEGECSIASGPKQARKAGDTGALAQCHLQ